MDESSYTSCARSTRSTSLRRSFSAGNAPSTPRSISAAAIESLPKIPNATPPSKAALCKGALTPIGHKHEMARISASRLFRWRLFHITSDRVVASVRSIYAVSRASFAAEVSDAADTNSEMNRRKHTHVPLHAALQAEAQSIAITVSAIRKARRKSVPADFDVDSREWYAAAEEFAGDVTMYLDGARGKAGSFGSHDLVDEGDDEGLGIGTAG